MLNTSKINIAIKDYCDGIKDPKVLEAVLHVLKVGYKCGIADQKGYTVNNDFLNKDVSEYMGC